MPESGPPGGSRTSTTTLLSVEVGPITYIGLRAERLIGSRVPIPGTPYTGEDLAPVGEVPVAKRRADDVSPRRPGAAAQDPVLVSEEDLRVLGVRERVEARIGLERGRGPLPHVAEHLNGAAAGSGIGIRPGGRAAEGELVEVGALAVGAGRRGLPLELRRQALAGPARERRGLVPGDVDDGQRRVER